ncbi:hypothetical protein ACSYT7_03070, partial [Escherichia coli]
MSKKEFEGYYEYLNNSKNKVQYLDNNINKYKYIKCIFNILGPNAFYEELCEVSKEDCLHKSFNYLFLNNITSDAGLFHKIIKTLIT